MKELIHFAPDLFVLYLGHNEYYGADGPASTAALGLGGGGSLARGVMNLRLSRVMQAGLRKIRGPGEAIKGKTVMEAMIGQTGIRPGDAIDRAATRGFERNLRAILREARGVPVLLCDQASNLRDLPPFQTTYLRSLSPEEQKVLDHLFFEHVHPRPEGQQLIADTVIRVLYERSLIAPEAEWNWAADRTPEEYRTMACLTPLDEEIADQRVFRLTHKWPFPENPSVRYASRRDPVVVEQADQESVREPGQT